MTLVSQMLVDDQVAGVHTSVLFASHTGALLYEFLGYQRLGTLHVFIPPSRGKSGSLGACQIVKRSFY